MENPNTNLLEGMRCPRCKSFGPFYIRAEITLEVQDSLAVKIDEDFDWGNDSYCECASCRFDSSVIDFKER